MLAKFLPVHYIVKQQKLILFNETKTMKKANIEKDVMPIKVTQVLIMLKF